jgi:hypothetical protein
MIIPPLIVCSDKKRQTNGNGTPFTLSCNSVRQVTKNPGDDDLTAVGHSRFANCQSGILEPGFIP